MSEHDGAGSAVPRYRFPADEAFPFKPCQEAAEIALIHLQPARQLVGDAGAVFAQLIQKARLRQRIAGAQHVAVEQIQNDGIMAVELPDVSDDLRAVFHAAHLPCFPIVDAVHYASV